MLQDLVGQENAHVASSTELPKFLQRLDSHELRFLANFCHSRPAAVGILRDPGSSSGVSHLMKRRGRGARQLDCSFEVSDKGSPKHAPVADGWQQNAEDVQCGLDGNALALEQGKCVDDKEAMNNLQQLPKTPGDMGVEADGWQKPAEEEVKLAVDAAVMAVERSNHLGNKEALQRALAALKAVMAAGHHADACKASL